IKQVKQKLRPYSVSASQLHIQRDRANRGLKVSSSNEFKLQFSSYQEIDLMKKVMLVTLMILAFGMFAMAQIGNPTSDVLGAHLNYGRGCAACHAPHSGAWGNGTNGSGDTCLLYTSPSPRDGLLSRMPSSA